MRFLLISAVFLSLSVDVSAAGESEAAPAPAASRRPVVDRYWNTDVVDDFQYLEKIDEPEVLDWVRGQARYTRAFLDGVPHRDAVADRVVSLTRSSSPTYWSLVHRKGRIFAIKRQPPIEQPFLIVMDSIDDLARQRIVVDPNVIDPTHHTTIDFYVPSPDARLVAVSLSQEGTEDGTLRIFEVATGSPLPDEIPRVNSGTAGGSCAWTAAGDALYYTRHPYPGERPDEDLPFYQRIWFHRLGRPIEEDEEVLGQTFPRIAEIELEAGDDGRNVLAQVSNGDGGEYEYWVLNPGRPWRRIIGFEDQVVDAKLGADDAVYLLSRRGAPRMQILRLAADAPDVSRATVLVPETEAVIEEFVPATERLYVVEMVGGPTRLRAYEIDSPAPEGTPARDLGLLDDTPLSSVGALVRLGGDALLFSRESYTEPSARYLYAPEDGAPRLTALVESSPADFGGCEVRREHAIAGDGTRIPIDILMMKGTPLDGMAPLILYGYGSYGISQTPDFSAQRMVWIEQGGIYAFACVRGGGEYGDAWHRAANLERKKTSIDDFAACARHLVERGYTSTERLAVQGGSAGGLLVYGLLVLYPDHAAAVVSRVGIADALRTERSPNGEFNVTEFGTVTDETQFRGMHAYSPYHHLKDGVAYPAVLSLAGMNDPRVEPWQSFKMTARLQATGTPNPVLLRVSFDTGHGRGTSLSEGDSQTADVYTFLFRVLGVEYRPVAPPSAD